MVSILVGFSLIIQILTFRYCSIETSNESEMRGNTTIGNQLYLGTFCNERSGTRYIFIAFIQNFKERTYISNFVK